MWAVLGVAGVRCGRLKITLPAKTFEAAMESLESNKLSVFYFKLLHMNYFTLIQY